MALLSILLLQLYIFIKPYPRFLYYYRSLTAQIMCFLMTNKRTRSLFGIAFSTTRQELLVCRANIGRASCLWEIIPLQIIKGIVLCWGSVFTPCNECSPQYRNEHTHRTHIRSFANDKTVQNISQKIRSEKRHLHFLKETPVLEKQTKNVLLKIKQTA